MAQIKKKIIAQSCDGASVMSWRIGGVQTKIKEMFTNVYFIHSYAHQLNLTVGQASSQNIEVCVLFCKYTRHSRFRLKIGQKIAERGLNIL